LGPYPKHESFLFLILNINYLYFFTLITITGTLIAVSASSWFTIWLGLEINLLRIIPILVKRNSFSSSDLTIKYFIIQAITSLIIISSVSLNLRSFFFYPDGLIVKIIIIALSIKAAIAPFHLWLTQIINNAEWPQIFILLTWQKITPLWVISSTYSEYFIIQLIIISALIGRLGGILVNSAKKIIIFSSVVHSRWILAIIFINKIIWVLYILVYFFLISNLSHSLAAIKINYMNKINALNIRKAVFFYKFSFMCSIDFWSPSSFRIFSQDNCNSNIYK